ncbi:MAG: hypothetical protein K0R60_742, partial [Microbacterium sp.]|nr:hypothetical protein [Microbacterium sp.]
LGLLFYVATLLLERLAGRRRH